MIISFYPGSGGSRYLNSLQGKEWQTPGISYDRCHNQHAKNRYPDPDKIVKIDPEEIILTHNVNTPFISQIFPGHSILSIVGDLRMCLQREWSLVEPSRYIEKTKNDKISKLEQYWAIADPTWPIVTSEEELLDLPSPIAEEFISSYQKLLNQYTTTDPLQTIINHYTYKIYSALETIKWHQSYYDRYPLDLSLSATVIDFNQSQCEFSNFMNKELALHNSKLFNTVWNQFYVS
jgi:hypothetical protein